MPLHVSPSLPDTERLRAALSDRYQIERELGAGGMATVYLARGVKHDREVALKVLRPDLSAVIGTERFLAEVRITARLDHPHILTLIDSGEADGILFYVLPFVRRESLRAKLEVPASRVTLKDRVQLTNTGKVNLATISDDGKTFAYVVTTCSRNGCRYAIDLKDVGGSVSRRAVDGATAIYDTELSPDRRNLLFLGSMTRRSAHSSSRFSVARRDLCQVCMRRSTRVVIR